jgi:hypothetical protein
MKEIKKIAEEVLKECCKQIEFLIDNGHQIKELTGGMVNLSKVDNFRDALAMVYIGCDRQGTILEKVELGTLYMFLDKGLFNEMELDKYIFMLQMKNEFEVSQGLKEIY